MSAAGYQLIYADPAWAYDDRNTNGRRGASCKYDVMQPSEIARMPVAEIAADNAVLAMWATWPMLPQALEVMAGWGFEFKTCAFVWVKTRTTQRQHAAFSKAVRGLGLDRGLSKRLTDALWHRVEPLVLPSLHVGLGRHTRSNTEFVLLGVRGAGLARLDKSVRQVVLAPLREHSRKPPEVRDALVQLYGPDVRRIELFARGSVPGWDVWGNQADEAVGLDLEPPESQLNLAVG